MLKSTHNTFYVDPVKGSLSGDGSAAKPWSTLAEVVNPTNKLISTQSHASGYNSGTDTALHPLNATGPVKAGDVILLLSGNHGSPKISNMYNADFITIAAAPGATPIVGPMTIVSSAKWVFQGVTFEGMATTTTGATTVQLSSGNLVTAGRGDWIGASSDVVFDSNTFRTAASTSGWTNADWYDKPLSVALWMSAPCMATTNNHFYNLLTALYAGAEKQLVQGNTIEYFSNDGMDIFTSTLLVKNNIIRNSTNNTSDPLHADGIQGWSPTVNGAVATNTNVVIDGNTLTKSGNASTSYMQGISIFDGKWDGLLIQNNVVNTATWHGIAVYGGTNSRVLNNTVIAADPVNQPSWITIHDAKDGSKATALVRNNIATTFLIQSTGATLDHNMAARNISLPTGNITSGSTGTANTVNAAVLNGFVALNTTTGTFDMRLKSTSVAVGAGTLTGAPTLDLLGKTRTSPVDLGAYVHQSSTSAAVSRAQHMASSSP